MIDLTTIPLTLWPASDLGMEIGGMGRAAAAMIDRQLRAVGGVVRVGRHAHPDGGSCYSVKFWHKGGRYVFGSEEQYTRWRCAVIGEPLPAWIVWIDQQREVVS